MGRRVSWRVLTNIVLHDSLYDIWLWSKDHNNE